jgi:HK97 family phage major capsid protein
MADIKAMREELERIKARAQAVLDANPSGLTAELNLEVTGLLKKATELQAQVKSEQQLEDKKRDLEQIDEFLNAPQYRIPHGVVGDGSPEDDQRKALLRAGWEFKAGIIFAPTSLGKSIAMYPEEVLFGDLPSVSEVGEGVVEFFRTTRRAFQPDYRKAYESYVRLCGKMHDASMAWTMLKPDQQKALSEGTDTAGGFLVPPDVQAEMLVRLPQKAAVRGAGARVQPTSRDVLYYPTVQAASATEGGLASGGGSIFSSGFVGTWAGETPAFTDKDPAFGNFQVPVRKIRVATKLANDFLSDAMVNVLAFLAQNGADNMALVEDNGFLNGIGTLQPAGILSQGSIATVDVEGSTTDTISNTTSNTGSAPKIIDVEYALPSQYTPNARWMFRRSIEGKIRKLVDAQGRFIWLSVAQSGYSAPAREIDSYPVTNSEFMPADGTNANQVILFGDFSNYIIAQRAQITSTILRERFADTDQTGIILWERVGGAVWNPDGFRVGIV